MILNLYDSLKKISDNFRGWIISHSSPVLMIVLFLGGLLIFTVAWRALHKNDE